MEGSFASPLWGRETILTLKKNIPALNLGAITQLPIVCRLIDGFHLV